MGDQPITYDAQGNPTHYLGHTLTWEKGRQLKSFDGNAYTYNANGIRTSKTVGGVLHTYALDGTKILRETWGSNTLIPLYDNEDSVCGVVYNNEPFYFQKNLQGDIIAIVDKNALPVARYSYDAWGVCTVTQDTSRCAIANINPYRYRGYYYDAEIGMYYLQSRYYNPAVGRWLNSDDANLIGLDGNILNCNFFTYCYNNLLNYVDPMGTSPLQVLLAAVFGVVGFVIGDYIARGCGLSPSGKSAWKYWVLRSAIAVGGAALGWFAGGLITKLLVKYLSRNPRLMLKLSSKLGSKFLVGALNFLGVNPIGLMDKSLLMGFLQTVFNNPNVTMPSAWVKTLLPLAEKYGWVIRLDSGHIGTRWNFTHLHIGKVHIAILKSIISFIKEFLKG